ncbi:MAG TPA: lipoprotein [Pseudomonadales bacterium]
MRWTILCLLATLVATCGQKGPLYLPEEPATFAFEAGRSIPGTESQTQVRR